MRIFSVNSEREVNERRRLWWEIRERRVPRAREVMALVDVCVLPLDNHEENDL